MTIGDLVPWIWGKKKLAINKEENPVWMIQKRMNTLFDDFLTGFDVGRFPFQSRFSGSFSPRVDVSEDDKELTVVAELPGLEERNIEVSLTRDVLTIRGEKKEEYEDTSDRNRYYVERSFGSFQRVIPISTEIDEDKVDASFKNGVLTIKLPKTRDSQREIRKITIR